MPHKLAYQTLRTRALNGHSESAWILGEAFLDGFGWSTSGVRFEVRKNRKTAVRWLRYASILNNADAMVSLAAELAASHHVKDIQKALVLEVRAYHLGNRLAAYNAALSCAMLGRPDDCFQWLCKGDLSITRLALAYCHAFGYGARRNIQKAKSLLKDHIRDETAFQSERECARSFLRLLNATPTRLLLPPPNSSPAFPLGKD